MAKVKMPLLGVKARGQIGSSVVMSTWRGVQYARTHVIPANPRTESQMAVRSVFTYLNELYKLMGGEVTGVWKAYAQGRALTDRNAFLKFNVGALVNATSVTDLTVSPGVGGGYACSALSLSTNSTQNTITATATVPTPPEGWQVVKVVFVAVCEQYPHEAVAENPRILTDDTAPYTVTFENLTEGQRYVIAAYPVWRKPDGKTAYGASINALSQQV